MRIFNHSTKFSCMKEVLLTIAPDFAFFIRSFCKPRWQSYSIGLFHYSGFRLRGEGG